MSGFAIGIDIGTTGTKVILFDSDRGIVAQASRESALYSPEPGFAEADPRQWLDNVTSAIRELLDTSRVDPSAVRAVSTSGMVPAVILTDASGAPLRPAILQNDARASREVADLSEELSELDLVALTGSALSQQSVAPTLRWVQRHEPDVWRRTVHVVGSYDWMLLALGAAAHVERNWAIESGLFSLGGDIVDAVFARTELADGLIPPVLDPGQRAGELSAALSAETGLREGTPLIVGGADHVLSAFAAGVYDSGDWLVKLGGAGDILVASDFPIVDPRLYLDVHPMAGRWLPNGCMATSGSLIRWFQTLIGGTALTELDTEAALRAPAEVLCLPYFLGEKSPLHDPELRGAFVGLHLGTSRADLYRSVLEAIAYGFRHHADVFTELGIPRRRVLITNGGSRSTLWKQIHADVLGTEVYPVVDHPGASLGAALIASVGAELIGGWDDCAAFLRLGAPMVPNPDNRARYDDAYAQWRELGVAVAPTSHHLARRSRA